MSPLDPDELTRLLTQAVDPIRPDPAAYQRIREGVAWRRRWRAPGLVLAGVAAMTLVVLAVLAIQPGPSAQVVEPATPILSSPVSDVRSDPSSTYRIGSGGTSTSDPHNPASPGGSVSTRPPPSASVSSSVTQSPSQSSSPPTGGSVSMPAPTSVPAMNGDLDGDGAVDPLRLVGTRLDATMSRGGVVSVDVPNVVTPLSATVLDLDRDGFGEVVVQTGAEANVKRYSVLRLATANSFGLVEAVGGVPLPLVAGVDPARGVAYGFRCTPATAAGSSLPPLTTFAATSTDQGETFVVVTTNWRLDRDLVVQIDSSPPGTPTTDRSLFTVGCGDLR